MRACRIAEPGPHRASHLLDDAVVPPWRSHRDCCRSVQPRVFA
jgi:hypothetical protein